MIHVRREAPEGTRQEPWRFGGVALPADIGGYRIVSRLGQGSMGTVFVAEQPNPKRLVALKLVIWLCYRLGQNCKLPKKT